MGNHDPYSDNTLDCEAGPDFMASFIAKRHHIHVLIGNCRMYLPLAMYLFETVCAKIAVGSWLRAIPSVVS